MIRINLLTRPKHLFRGWQEGPFYSILDKEAVAIGVIMTDEERRKRNDIDWFHIEK